MVCFADINVSQSSVAAYARCDGIFSIHLTTNLSRNLAVKIFLNRFRFDRIVALSPWPHFFAHPYVHTYTHQFNCPLSGTTWVSRYQKGKTNLDFTEARDNAWQRHQLGHMQVCTSLQTDNHASIPQLSYLQPGALSAAQPAASKHWRHTYIHTYWSNVWVCVCVCSVCAVGEARTAVLCKCLLRSSVCHQVQLVSGRRVRYWSYLLLQSGIHLYICTW